MSKAIIGLLKYEPGPGAYIECLCIPVDGEGKDLTEALTNLVITVAEEEKCDD